ncbi:hypothetical protein [Ornithinimicrobium panacihumi]|uniref:hypothetical protein n=1 Tax=Ornithinimicrobium panacihumi TaxID=2008449 RepID=UPI003F8B89E4
MVWEFDFSEYETAKGGTWWVAGIADYWSKYEFGWHWSPTANQHDAVAAVQLALTEAASMLPEGMDLLEYLTDPETGEVVPITLVTDNGGPFRSARFAALIENTPELDHVRTRVRTPGQNGVRERAFQSLKYERLYREQIDDIHDLAAHGEDFRGRVQHDPAPRSTVLEPTPRRAPGPGRPRHTQLSRRRKPATSLTRDTSPSHVRPAIAHGRHVPPFSWSNRLRPAKNGPFNFERGGALR